jgi:nicotinamidase-related amidase
MFTKKGLAMNALLLIEIQHDHFSNGKNPLEKSAEASIKAKSVLDWFRQENLPVIHVQHISTHPNATYFLPCTSGAEFQSNTQPIKGEIIIQKHYPNCFKDTRLLTYLNKQKIKHLTICGMMTQLAIDSTVRAARDYGFTCQIIEDACAAAPLKFNHQIISAQQVHYAFLAALEPFYASLLNAEAFLQHHRVEMPMTA